MKREMQNIFKRYEKKYIITREQYPALKNVLSRHMSPDCFGKYLVQNLYYDTDKWDVVRASIEKPVYKEKMRLRCYGALTHESVLFLELKKKYKGIVYKRRMPVPAETFSGNSIRNFIPDASQIAREFDFYIKTNAVSEKIYISYKRIAYVGIAEEGLRVTFDADVRFRLDCLDYSRPGDGHAILPQGKLLMEVKTPDGMPVWLARALCENKIFPTAFSKYGVCYTNHILRAHLKTVAKERLG